MEKIEMSLFRIGKNFKVKLSQVTKEDPETNPMFQKYKKPIIEKYTLDGSDVITSYHLNPMVVFTVDMYDATDRITRPISMYFTKFYLYKFLQTLKDFISHFSVKDLYVIKDGVLLVNQERSKEFREVFQTSTKKLLLQHIVVPDETNNERYEGAILAIGAVENYTYLTYDQLKFLYSELANLDMDTLVISMINNLILLKLSEKSSKEQIRRIEIPVNEELREDFSEKPPPKPMEEVPAIPNI